MDLKHMNGTPNPAPDPFSEITRFWEAGQAAPLHGGEERAETKSGPGWQDALARLQKQFPDHRPSLIAAAVFSVYAARVSENRQTAFAVYSGRAQDAQSHGTVFEFGLAADATFAGVMEDFAGGAFSTEEPGSAGSAIPDRSTVPLAVTTGARPQDAVSADIHLHIEADGSLIWGHPAAVGQAAFSQICERMAALAAGIAEDPERLLVHQPIMSAAERTCVVQTWNATDRAYGYDGGLVAMMERAAAASPDHPALIFKEHTLSFAEFNARVNRLARLLRGKGVGPDTFVALFMDRSLEMVIGLWAVLKAGGAYVPLNTEDPAARLSEILDDCKPVAVLTQAHLQEKIGPDVSNVIVLPEGGDPDPDAEASNPGLEIKPQDLAYMIYTSGSTGKPKGVIVEHEAIHNRVVWMHEEYGLEPQDRVLQKTPYTFDVSVWEFLWPFVVGSTLVVAIPGGHMSIRYLQRVIKEAGVTHLHFVPSMLRLFLLAPSLSTLPIKKLFCSGEALGFDLVQGFYEKANDAAEVHNLYGPTEAAVDVSYYACPRKASDRTIPIGKPVSNTGLYVLDEHDQPVPVGVPGELHIGGVQLARGYWKRDDLTRQRFVPCPLADAPHRRLYRTGDLAYFRPDGQIIYLGRNDFQVKISGVRIELGEIEAAVRSADGVRDVVVVAEENDGMKSLVAYVVSSDRGEEAANRIKTAVMRTCPPFYVPQDVRFLAEMPLTVSGKINRKALKDQARL
ncbi:amino acid adenylation domain-containing protein [Roseibium denhamense]|uniref:Amino acid adenylation domain-containing protein n=1 Tax=Roseibium denhamense TaxID=76305 RepID=A0ABY1NEP6_9HYPH|nr:amino acid adenylation domain-containing protein [Roseibium denhamense]MTI04314.1 amino acid adenylation domain-containing protein [Roseibium denhamense]SMP07083.1 amino acid adenylation domain-containing protein [Roseibium denhamense]